MTTTFTQLTTDQTDYYNTTICPESRGWIQLVTAQDSPIFGIWYNTNCLTVIMVVDGEEVIDEYDTKEEFDSEIANAKNYFQ